ncbi:hypothetical protein DFR70_104350 [Nocardia tenerifensis]|uniref:Uncharacterized protein n=1 Tax=Nocardia tenerifensis TaxID=228006 RepID=A0A318KQS5_9NOCA|nr:hypothetical protein [Nocardia tenerifensis]PXX65287.1 hypothetical protein DFR70_104350 [Nocardia tenerifensis]
MAGDRRHLAARAEMREHRCGVHAAIFRSGLTKRLDRDRLAAGGATLPFMIAAVKGSVGGADAIAERGSTYSASEAPSYSSRKGWQVDWRMARPCAQDSRTPNAMSVPVSMRRRCRKPLGPRSGRVVAGSLRDLEKSRVLSAPGMQYETLATVAGMIPRTLAARPNRGLFTTRGRT